MGREPANVPAPPSTELRPKPEIDIINTSCKNAIRISSYNYHEGAAVEQDLKIVKLTEIYLDPENPRHNPIDTEPGIIAFLLKHEGVKALARDIAERKSLSPIDLIALAPHPKLSKGYIPAEGNRRICALKLLNDPERAPTESDKKYFRQLRTQIGKPITSFAARIFDSKDEARPWVSLRHEGERGGVGTKNWDSKQKSRFNMESDSPTNPNNQGVQLLDYAMEQGLITAEQRDSIAVTTLTRYLSNPVVRDTFGLENSRDLTITVPPEEFNRVIKRFLNDALEQKDISSRTNVQQRRDYAAKIRADGDAPTTRGQPPTPAATAAAAAKADSKSGAASKTRNGKSRDNDVTVIPASFKAQIDRHKYATLKRLYDELRELDAKFAFSAAFLLRALIEQACTNFLKERQKGVALPKELHHKIEKVEKELEKDGVQDGDRKFLRVMSQSKDSSGSPDTLGHFIHGGSTPSKHDVFRTWDNISAAMIHIFNNLK